MNMRILQRWQILVLVVVACMSAGPALATSTDLIVSASYRFRNDDRGVQNGFRSYADLNTRDIFQDRLDLVFTGWTNLNVFGFDRPTIENYYFRASQAYLYLKAPEMLTNFTIGRQYLGDVDNFNIDGVNIDARFNDAWRAFGYAGRPVSDYSDTAGDIMGGLGAEYKPWRQTTVEADAFLLQEEGTLYAATALRLNQFFDWQHLRLFGRVRTLQNEVRDVYSTFGAFIDAADLSVNGAYFIQPDLRGTGEQAYSRDFSNYGAIFNGSYPFHRFGLNLQYYMSDNWLLDGGMLIKRLLGSAGASSWSNVDSTVFNAGITRQNLLTKGLDLTLLGNFVNNPGSWFTTVTGDVRYEFSKQFEGSTGVTFSGYRFNNLDFPVTLNSQPASYDLSDHIGSCVYYVDFKYKPSQRQKINLAASYEVMSERYVNSLMVQLRWQYHFTLP